MRGQTEESVLDLLAGAAVLKIYGLRCTFQGRLFKISVATPLVVEFGETAESTPQS
ncbi:hypothetical protein HOK021_17030 [Streptomyces hygroscopicus]|nr:hypothetical protein HOK021_17030 [Streptomyces hygroscopicus]